ncbi:MAG: hypothetical protein RML35_11815 [Chloroherpetonaceae bacterium]|nr:hypothetical protein [Chloroherpetonaceae bacterium]
MWWLGSSFGISRNQTLTINGTVIVENGAELTGVNIGTASGNPTLAFGLKWTLGRAQSHGTRRRHINHALCFLHHAA